MALLAEMAVLNMRHRPASFDATMLNPKSADGVGDLIHDEQTQKKERVLSISAE